MGLNEFTRNFILYERIFRIFIIFHQTLLIYVE